MLSDGGCIKEVQIKLLLSSRNEMQKVIETARQQAMQLTHVYMQQMQQPQLSPMVGSLPPLTAKVHYNNTIIVIVSVFPIFLTSTKMFRFF